MIGLNVSHDWIWYSPIFKNTCIAKKYLMDNEHSHLMWKYTQICVPGHYLSFKAHSFPQAMPLEKYSLFRTENVWEISKHIFRQIEVCLIYNFGKILHTEFADLVDTLTTQLKPTAAKIKIL